MRYRVPRVIALLMAVAVCLPSLAGAKEYLLTGAKPDRLLLIDASAREVEREYVVPEAGNGLLTITPSPDGKIAYVICNRWESVAGIDLDTGEQVFRADFSTPDVRVKATFAMDISPDGKELYVFQSPVKLKLGEYEVQDTYIAVFDTSTGLGAKPVRTFAAPRRTAILASSKDGSKLYALNWDITVFDPKTGEVTGTHKVRNWERENYSEPDVLDVWPQWEQAGVFSTLYYTARTDPSPDAPAVYKTGILTLDLATDEMVIKDFEDTSVVIFSSVVNPVRRNEAYAVYTQLSKIDLDQAAVVKRIDLDHTYYDINVSGDGSEIYVGGTMSDIAVYSSESLERLGKIDLPGGGDQTLASLRVIQR